MVLSVKDLKAPGLAGVSFAVRAGEILGVGGLPDSGKDGLGEALFGLYPREGSVTIDGAETPADALACIRCGMSFVPADRRGAGGLLAMSVADNVVSASLKRFSIAGVLQRATIRREARAQVARLDARIRAPRAEAWHPVRRQSAEDHSRPQPCHATRACSSCTSRRAGSTSAPKPRSMAYFAGSPSEGVAIVLISSEVPELIMNAERVLVMRRGRISGELRGEAMSEAEILGRAMAS